MSSQIKTNGPNGLLQHSFSSNCNLRFKKITLIIRKQNNDTNKEDMMTLQSY